MKQETIPSKPTQYLDEEQVRQVIDSMLQNYQNSVRILSGSLQVNSIRLISRSADPTSGTHVVGELIMVGSTLKRCTVAGSPGTFVAV